MPKTLSGEKDKKQISKDFAEALYGTDVLLGNWFEERFSLDNVNPKAIVPGGSDRVEKKHCTLYSNDFMDPLDNKKEKLSKEFNTVKLNGFKNSINNTNSNIQIMDGEQFCKNLTTSTDFWYRIMSREAKRKQKMELPENILKPKSQVDTLKSYGNSTETGLLPWLRCEQQREMQSPLDVSHYKQNYKITSLGKAGRQQSYAKCYLGRKTQII